MRVPYSDLPGLEHVYLEDSYVLDLRIASDSVEFELNAVLTPEHPLYEAPLPHQQYCMRRAALRFPNATVISANRSRAKPAVDAAGEVDYGNIDVFYRRGTAYHLSGEWGDLELVSDPPLLTTR